MWPRFGYRWARYGIGRIPMPAPKVDTVSRQERRNALVNEYIREQAEAMREAQQKPAVASQRKYLPLQGGGRPQSEAMAGGWGSFQRSAKTPTPTLPLAGGGSAHSANTKPARDVIDDQSEQGKLRLALMRKLMPFVTPWRDCPAGTCRRHRRCVSANLECQSQPARRVSPAREQAALAHFQRALARRRTELETTGHR